MPSELDLKYDRMLAAVIGPGGRLVIGEDDQGRAIVTNFPATLPSFFRTFCALNAQAEAIVAGEERLSFADLDSWSERLAHALVSRGVRKGDRVGIAMRNCPAWVVSYMAIAKAGGIAALLNGWWQPHEMQHALDMVEPKLIIADAPRAKRIAGVCGTCALVTLPIEEHLESALAPLLDGSDPEAALPEVTPEDDATILFTSGSTGESKGALSTHRAVTTGVYAYATGLIVLLGIMTEENRAPASKRTLINVPLFHVTGEVPVMLNSFVISRTMVMMAKWDAGEALRLIDKEGITYFVGVPTMSLELMNHPGPRQVRPVVADRHRGRRCAASGQPCRAAGEGIPEGAAGAWLRADRDERGRLFQFLGQLRREAGFDRPGAEAVRRTCDPRRGRCASAFGRARRDRDQVRREHQMLLGRPGSDRRGLHGGRIHPHRRHRLRRRGRLSVHRRPQEGHHHSRRREYRLRGGRSGNLRLPRSRRSLRIRHAG